MANSSPAMSSTQAAVTMGHSPQTLAELAAFLTVMIGSKFELLEKELQSMRFDISEVRRHIVPDAQCPGSAPSPSLVSIDAVRQIFREVTSSGPAANSSPGTIPHPIPSSYSVTISRSTPGSSSPPFPGSTPDSAPFSTPPSSPPSGSTRASHPSTPCPSSSKDRKGEEHARIIAATNETQFRSPLLWKPIDADQFRSPLSWKRPTLKWSHDSSPRAITLAPTECKEPEKGQKEESGLSDLVLLLDLFHVGNPRQAQSSPVFPCRWPTNPTPKISAAPKKYRKPLPGFSYASRPSEAEKVQKKENPLPDLIPAPEPSHIANPREAQSGSVFPCSHTSKKETKPQDVPMAKEKHQNADGLDSMADIEHSNNPVEQQSSSPSQEQSAPAATHVEGEAMDTDEDMGEECEEEYHSDMDEDDISDKASAMDEDDVALEEDEPMDTDAPLAAEIHEAMAIDLSHPVEAPQIPIITAPYKIEAVNVTTTNSHEVDMNENAGTEEASFVPEVVQPAPLRQGAAFRKWICEQLGPLVEALDEKMSHIPHLHNIRPNGDELKDLVLQRLFTFYFKNVSSEAGPYQACLANAQNDLALCSKAVTIHGHLPKNIPGLQDFVKHCNTAISHHFAKSLVLIEGDIPSNVISREVRSKQLLKLFKAITRANSRLAMLYASRGYGNVHMTKFSSRFPSEESSATYKKMMEIAQNLEHQQALRALSKNTSFKENVYAEVYMENAVDDFDNVDTNLENHLDDIHKDDKSYSICKRDGGVSHLENILQREMWAPKLPQAYPLPFQNSSIDVAIRKATVNDLFMWIPIANSSWTIQHGYSLITNEDDIKSTALREERVILSKAVEELDKSIFTSDEKGNMNLSERSIVNQMNYWTISGKSSLDKYKAIKDHVERRFVTEPNEALKDIARDPNGSLREDLISLYDRKRLKGTEPVVLPDAPLVSDTSEEEEAEQARRCGSWIHTHMLKYAARFRGEPYQKSYLDSKPWYKLESGKGELEYEEDDDEKWPEEYRA